MKKNQEDYPRTSDETASLRGTSHSLDELGTGPPEEVSSVGSDSEVNGFSNGEQKIDKYGFIGGAQYTGETQHEVPPEVLRQRESKWLDMLSNWDKWMAKKHKKAKLRCQKGIPPSLRGRAWQYLSGSKVKMEQNYGKFEELDRLPGDPAWLDVIERDLHRQFPFHEMFVARGGHGQQDLYRVLKAYTIYRPEEGYCQAQAPVAAVLLMHMPAEQAFWCLVQICEKYLPGYYSAGLCLGDVVHDVMYREAINGQQMFIALASNAGRNLVYIIQPPYNEEAIQLDGEILFALLRKVSPVAHKHLNKYKIDSILYMTEWFMCAFSRTLPWVSVLRVWDMFFCEGVKVIFRVGLVLLKYTLGSPDKLKSCKGQYETMEKLRSIDSRYMDERFLVLEVIEIPISEKDIEKEHLTQLKKWKTTHGDLKYKPQPRLHGAKAINKSEPHSHKALEQAPSIVINSPPVSPPPDPNNVPRKKKEKSSEKKKGAGEPMANGSGSGEAVRFLDDQCTDQPGDTAAEASQPAPHTNSALQQSTQSLSSGESEQDTYL